MTRFPRTINEAFPQPPARDTTYQGPYYRKRDNHWLWWVAGCAVGTLPFLLQYLWS